MQIEGTKIIFRRPKILKKFPTSSLAQWLPALFYLANLYMRTGHSSLIYRITLIVSGVVGLLTLMFKKMIRRDVVYISMLIFFVSGMFNWFLIGNTTLVDLVNDALLFGVLVLMIVFPMGITPGTIFFCISVATFIYAYLSGTQAFSVLTSSGNYVSVLLILSAALYYISLSNSQYEFKLKHLFPAVLCFLLSLWAKGRGGILACVVLLVSLVFFYLYNYMQSGGSIRPVLVALAILGVIGYLLIRNISIIDTFFSLGRWSYRGADNTARELIWGAYYEKVRENFVYVINGAPLDQISIIHSFNNNTHNSFIQLHANNGLIPFVLCAVFMIKSILYYITNNNTILAIVLFTIFVRGMTDKFIFGQYGMPIMLYLVIFPYIDQYVKEHGTERNHHKLYAAGGVKR